MLSYARQAGLTLGAVGLMWLLPFLNDHHQLPIASFYSELIAAALGLVGMTLLLRREAWQPFELPRIALLPLALAGLILLQMPLGLIAYPQQALLGMLYLLWAVLLMALGYRLRLELGWERISVNLSWWLLAGGVLSALVTLLQLAGLHGTLLMPKLFAQSYGNLAQANNFADYISLSLAALLLLWNKRRLRSELVVVLATVFLAVLALSGSRSVWLYLAVFAALAWALQIKTRDGRLLIFSAVLLPAFLLIQQLMPMLAQALGAGSDVTPAVRLFQEVSGAEMRLGIWRQAWQMFMEHPWLGVGFGQFDWHSFLMMDRMGGMRAVPVEHAHNIVLQLLAEQGLFAALLCVALPLGWLARTLRGGMDVHQWWLLALLGVLGVHSMLEYPLWYAFFLGVAAVLLGAGEQRVLPLALQRIGPWALAAVLLLGSIGLSNLAISYGQLENWMRRAMLGQINDQNLPAAASELMQIHRDSLLSPYVELVLAMAIEPSRQMLDQKLLLSGAAMRFSPARQIVYRHAVLLALKGDREQALVQLGRAARAYPGDLPGFVRELERLAEQTPGVYEFLLIESARLAKE